MSTLYPGGDYPVTPNLGLALWDMSFEMAENMILIDTAVGSGSSVQINGSVIANPNFNNTTPAAPAGKSNVLWQVSGSNVSAYVDSASVHVNGSVVANPNFNDSTPAAPAAGIQAIWQSDVNGNISSYITIPSTLHVPNTTTLTPSSGNLVTLQTPANVSVQVLAPNAVFGDASLVLSAGLAGLNGGSGGGVYLNDPSGGGITLNTAAGTIVTDTLGSVWNNATGGTKGAGTINALGLYINGVAVSTYVTPLTTLGDMLYENATPTATRLAGNTTSTKMYLSQTGTGSASAAPVWAQINYADITGTVPTPPSGSVLWSDLGAAGADLTLANAGFNTTFNQTSAVNWKWANTTAATSGVSQSSPIHNFNGKYWDGAASQTDSWTLQNILTNGTNGASTLTFAHTGSTGTASVALPSKTSFGGVSGFQAATGNAGNFSGTFLQQTTNTFLNIGWYHGVNQRSNGLLAGVQGSAIAWASSGGNPGGTGLGVGIWDAYVTANSTLGRLNFGQSMIAGDASATVAFKGTACGLSITALSTPSAPTVTVQSGAGASTWGYKVVVRDASGTTIASAEATVSNNANLTSAATNKVVINRVDGAQSYDIYRTTVGTSPNTTGKIATIQDWGGVKGSSTANGVSQFFIIDTGIVTLSSVTVVGASTTYNGVIAQSALNALAGIFMVVTGFANSGNNGTFQVVSSNANNFTVTTTTQITETHAGTATVAGDGTAVPTTGLNTAGGINLIPPTAAIPGTVAYSSGLITLGGYYFNGSGVTADSWTIQNAIGPLTNDSSLLELLHSGTPGTAGVLIGNTSFTTAIASSPYLILGGSYEVSVSLNTFAEDNWYFQNVIGAGANGTSTLAITHTGTSGVAKVTAPAFQVTGKLFDASGAAGSSGQVLSSTGTTTSWIAQSALAANATSLQGISVATVTPQTGDTLRYNEWGDSKWDVCQGMPFYRVIYADVFNANLLAIPSGTNPATAGTLSRVAPTATEPVMIKNLTAAAGSTSVTAYVAWQSGGLQPFSWGTVRRFSTRLQLLHTANVRYLFGLFSNGATPPVSVATDTPNMHYAAFRYSAGTDSTIKAICGTATGTLTVVDTSVAVDVNNSHVFDIAFDGTNTNFFIDGVLKAQISTTLPSAADNMQPSVLCDNQNTANAVGWSMAWLIVTPK